MSVNKSANAGANVKPRIILHGGAGNITPENTPEALWNQYKASLLRIIRDANAYLQQPTTTAIDAAVHCVQLLESDPLFNAGKGAVFNREGKIELEASIMVSRGYKKRGAAVSLLRHVKSPIHLAAEVLKRGEVDLVEGGGGQGHCHLSGPAAEGLARDWGLEMVDEDYFWTQKRWDEHKKGLARSRANQEWEATTRPDGTSPESEVPPEYETALREDDRHLGNTVPAGLGDGSGDVSWNGKDYLPQGTVGCVVLDRFGTLAVGTSTGGLTNKVPGRIGDTPTLGAGFWAEEWMEKSSKAAAYSPTSSLGRFLPAFCMPSRSSKPSNVSSAAAERQSTSTSNRATAMSGTGNGDSFLRVNAVRTASAKLRFSNSNGQTLQDAVSWMVGPGGELQQSAGDRWGKTGEGEGGIIGIEFRDGEGEIVFDFNRGMFRAWVDKDGKEHAAAFRNE